MNVQEVKAAVKLLPNIALHRHNGEWRVTIKALVVAKRYSSLNLGQVTAKVEKLAYYTTQNDDAYATAKSLNDAWNLAVGKSDE